MKRKWNLIWKPNIAGCSFNFKFLNFYAYLSQNNYPQSLAKNANISFSRIQNPYSNNSLMRWWSGSTESPNSVKQIWPCLINVAFFEENPSEGLKTTKWAEKIKAVLSVKAESSAFCSHNFGSRFWVGARVDRAWSKSKLWKIQL